MKKLIIGLMLAVLLLVPVSCAPAVSELEVEEEEPSLTEEEEKELALKGILHASTVEEASRIAGYSVATPAFLPEGFHRSDIAVSQLLFGNWPRIVEQHWGWQEDSSICLVLIQDPKLEGVAGGEPAEVCGVPGQRALLEADLGHGRPHPLLAFFWRDDDVAYVVNGTLAGPLTEEILLKIACSVRIEYAATP